MSGKKEVFTKTSTYLSDKTRKVLDKVAKAKGVKKYEIVNEAILLYASKNK